MILVGIYSFFINILKQIRISLLNFRRTLSIQFCCQNFYHPAHRPARYSYSNPLKVARSMFHVPCSFDIDLGKDPQNSTKRSMTGYTCTQCCVAVNHQHTTRYALFIFFPMCLLVFRCLLEKQRVIRLHSILLD